MAIHQPTGPVTVAQIARRQRIPLRYLEQLLNRLRRKGLVVAERGPRGGYRLIRHPAQISAREIFQGLESAAGSSRRIGDSDPAESVWRQVEEAVQTTLEATTLEALVAQARQRLPASVNHRFTFYI
jgi:Rrf2 family iron-sulfur cluster assembly transcriptional regulator